MRIQFYKYHGAGNDFVMIDHRQQKIKNDTNLIKHLCDRRFGIGGDGLILLENSIQTGVDFKMLYFNANGQESTMCGNGGRCIVAFAKHLHLINNSCTFEAVDGLHAAKIEDDLINLKMIDVSELQQTANYCFLDTGSPHHIEFVDNVNTINVNEEGAKWRYSDHYKPIGGSNINFVELGSNHLNIRTYERGVEDETLACGTGVTAAALAAHVNHQLESPIAVSAQGGELSVSFEYDNHQFTNVWLKGPAQQVFKGEINVK